METTEKYIQPPLEVIINNQNKVLRIFGSAAAPLKPQQKKDMELTIEQRKKILDYIEDRWEYDCCYDKEIDLGNELRVEIDADGEGATLSFWTDEDTEVEVEGIRKLEDEIMDLCSDLRYEYEKYCRDLEDTERSLGAWLISQGNYMGA